MSLLLHQSRKYILLSLLSIAAACDSKDDDKDLVVEPPPPNTCKAMVNLGTWPGAGSVSTWVYGCFEGYEDSGGVKSYLADECREAVKAPGFEFVQFDSPTCPEESATAVCQGKTFKIVAYQQDPANFDVEQFKKYCESKAGSLSLK